MAEIFVLENQQYHLKIHSLGAELIHFSKREKENLLWEKTTAHWNRVAPLLFPIVGKLKDNAYSLQEDGFALGQHGFLRDQEFTLLEQNKHSLTLTFSSDSATKKVYPFDFTFEICYAFDSSGLRIEATIKNRSESKMYFSYGGHPAFHLEEKLENYFLRLEKDFVAERQLIENGLYSGATEKMSISGDLQLNDDLFHADALVFKQPPFQTIELLHNTKGSILKMTCESWTAIGIWTKAGAPFLCLEPWWGWADSTDSTGDLTQKAGIRVLESNVEETLVYRIEPAI
ncbi:MAG: aldose 1-epimerase family protein [Crocinitomicaceae bacterium]